MIPWKLYILATYATITRNRGILTAGQQVLGDPERNCCHQMMHLQRIPSAILVDDPKGEKSKFGSHRGGCWCEQSCNCTPCHGWQKQEINPICIVFLA